MGNRSHSGSGSSLSRRPRDKIKRSSFGLSSAGPLASVQQIIAGTADFVVKL